ncbi:MAG: DivIVA domain-containing protein [Oscillospiraceae bacterium]|nr:DivIVA domain-containing protein [Oscillospiraceae bacterium]
MTPSDILNKTFQRGMSGYRTEEVNAFLAEAGEFAKQIVAENRDLTAKIEVLAEKISEYRSDEESLRAALIGAQKLGETVIREAKLKAQAVLDVAAKQADDIMGDAKRNIELENFALEKKRLEAAKFKKQLIDMYSRHMELINALPYNEGELDPLPAVPSIIRPSERDGASAAQVLQTARIEDEKDRGIAPTAAEEFADVRLAFDEVPEPDAGQDEFPRRKSRFGNLRFGEGFDPVRDE